MKNYIPINILTFAGTISLFIGALNMPYEYYGFLRAFVCLISIHGIWMILKSSKMMAMIYLISLILFNPIWKIVLEKSSWRIIDILFGFIFLYLSYVPKEWVNKKERGK